MKEVALAFEAEDGLFGVGSLGLNEADSRSKFELAGVKVLAVGAVEGIGDAEDSREIVKGVFAFFG